MSCPRLNSGVLRECNSYRCYNDENLSHSPVPRAHLQREIRNAAGRFRTTFRVQALDTVQIRFDGYQAW